VCYSTKIEAGEKNGLVPRIRLERRLGLEKRMERPLARKRSVQLSTAMAKAWMAIRQRMVLEILLVV